MSPITHFLAGWAVAATAKLEKRDRMLVALAGVVPDIDGLGAVVDLFTRHGGNPFEFYQRYHHLFGHNAFFALLAASLALVWAERKNVTAGLALLSFHLHLLGDYLGARGDVNDFWGVPYFWPVSGRDYFWSRQWPLNGWQNFAITGVLLVFTFWRAWRRGCSPLEMVSAKADRAFVQAVRTRLGNPQEP